MTSTARSLRYALAIPDHFVGDTFRLGTCAFNASVSCGKRASDSAPPQAITLNFSEGVETGIQWCKKSRGQKTKILKHYRRSEMSRTKSN